MRFKVQNSKFKIADGYTLLELIVTMTVLAIFVMGTIPLTQNAVRRQKEIRLRQVLREMRNAIDEFKRDAKDACPPGSQAAGNPTIPGGNLPVDPRSRFIVDDCALFDNDLNVDHYPPTLEVLAEGVKVKRTGLPPQAQSGGVFSDRNATDLNGDQEEIIKHYLRELPLDPMTGEADWRFRSSTQSADSDSWDEVNVFDVRSSSDGEALNGEKYSDW